MATKLMTTSVRPPYRTAAVLVALALALGGLLSACGGGDDGPRLSRTAYTKQANAECATLKQASDDLALAQDPSATGEQVREYLNKAANGLGELADGLESLNPPEAIEGDAEDLGTALAEYGDGLHTLAGKVGANETFTEALGSNQKIVRKLNGLAEQATELVGSLGIDGCQITA